MKKVFNVILFAIVIFASFVSLVSVKAEGYTGDGTITNPYDGEVDPMTIYNNANCYVKKDAVVYLGDNPNDWTLNTSYYLTKTDANSGDSSTAVAFSNANENPEIDDVVVAKIFNSQKSMVNEGREADWELIKDVEVWCVGKAQFYGIGFKFCFYPAEPVFDTNGGSKVSLVDDNPTTPTLEGCKFLGWFTEKEEGEVVTSFEAGVVYYAHWEHVAKTEWTFDEEKHYHECGVEGCSDHYDEGEHTYDEGVVTTKATKDAEGVKTYTCTVCGKTITEAIPMVEKSGSAGLIILIIVLVLIVAYVVMYFIYRKSKKAIPGIKTTYKFWDKVLFKENKNE